MVEGMLRTLTYTLEFWAGPFVIVLKLIVLLFSIKCRKIWSCYKLIIIYIFKKEDMFCLTILYES